MPDNQIIQNFIRTLAALAKQTNVINYCVCIHRDGINYAKEIGQNSETDAGGVTPNISTTLDCLLLFMTKGIPIEHTGKPPLVSKNLFILNGRHFVSKDFVELYYLLAIHAFNFSKTQQKGISFFTKPP